MIKGTAKQIRYALHLAPRLIRKHNKLFASIRLAAEAIKSDALWQEVAAIDAAIDRVPIVQEWTVSSQACERIYDLLRYDAKFVIDRSQFERHPTLCEYHIVHCVFPHDHRVEYVTRTQVLYSVPVASRKKMWRLLSKIDHALMAQNWTAAAKSIVRYVAFKQMVVREYTGKLEQQTRGTP